VADSQKQPISERNVSMTFGPRVDPLIDSHRAAQFLGVHPRTLQRMVLRGEISGVKVGKLWRFVPSTLQDWVTRHSIAS
jgi:excisionase family DNA binding protein